MKSINILSIRNPFSRSDRTIQKVEFSAVMTVEGYVRQSPIFFDGEHYHVTVNGGLVDPKEYRTITINEGSYITICPVVAGGSGGGKSIVSLIASLALAYVSFGVGGLASGGAWGAAAATWTTTGMLMAAATMFLGGMLISRLTPTPKMDKQQDSDQTQTYSWGNLQPLQGQGHSVGITYGTVRAAPQILSQHVSTSGDKQYLNILLCAGEGPMDKFENLRINDNPIENFKDIIVDTRLGTNTQSAISYFGDTYADMSLNYDLNTIGTWRIQRLNTNATQGLEIQIELPAGLCHMGDTGKTQSGWVRIDAMYRRVGETVWTGWLSGFEISAAQTSPLRRVFRKDDLEIGQYEVQVRCSAKSGTSATKDVNSMTWSQVSSVLYDDFRRPNRALVGIRALATDQLSGGLPSITYEQTRSTVWVYNPNKGIYEEEAADNPAWACYDLVHYCRKLQHPLTREWQFKVYGAKKDKIIYSDFKSWADWCVKMNLKVNLFIEQKGQLDSKMQDISIVGRGRVIRRGTKFGCICDMPTEPVQLFTMGNIVSGSFNVSYLELPERANEVEITFPNREKNWEKDIIQVYGKDWDNDDTIKNPTSISMDGITSWEQAYRQAKYMLKSSEYIIETISFDADVDAIACQVGDVILVQHDLPKWGFGGRILGGNQTSLRLDREAFMQLGSVHEIRVKNSQTDEIVQREIEPVSEDTTTTTLILKDPLGFDPEPYDDVYTFGEIDKSAKPFRLIETRRSSDQTRTLTALEHIPEIYLENYDFPQIDYVANDGEIRNLIAANSFSEDGTYRVNISWTAPRSDISKVRLTINGKKIAEIQPSETFYQWEPTLWGNVAITAIAINNLGLEVSSVGKVHYVTSPIPDDVPQFEVTFISQGKQFVFDWVVPEGLNPISGYEIRRGQAWEAGQAVKRIDGRQIIREDLVAVRGRSKFWICAYNKYGYSLNPLACDIDVEQMPGRDVVDTIYDYEETGEVSGYGELIGGSLVQWSGLTVEYINSHLWAELKDMDWLNGCMGSVVVVGKVIDIGKPASVIIWTDEIWSQVPDKPSLWEYQSSFDNAIYSDWRPLPLTEVEGRYFKFRITVRGVARSGILQNGNLIFDVPENTVKLPAVEVPIQGVYVSFTPGFVRAPTIQVTPNDEALVVEKTQISGDGCFIKLFKLEWKNNQFVQTATEGFADLFATGF